MSIDGQDLTRAGDTAERIEQIDKQLAKGDEELKLLEDKLQKAEKDLHRDPFFPQD